MFNPERKRAFIRSYTKNIRIAALMRKLFDQIEPFEQTWNADLCTRSAQELQEPVYKMMKENKLNRFFAVSMLRAYVHWCRRQKVDGVSDGIFGVQIDGLDDFLDRYVVSPAHLQRCLDQLFDAESMESAELLLRGYLWLSFSGVLRQDLMSVTNSDVDFSERTVSAPGGPYPIYAESIPTLRPLATLNEFSYYHPDYPMVRRERLGKDALLRGIRSEGNESYYAAKVSRYVALAREHGASVPLLSAKRVWTSGVFYRAYQQEQAGLPIDFETPAMQKVGDKQYARQSDSENRVVRLMEDDYAAWKLAFRLV